MTRVSRGGRARRRLVHSAAAVAVLGGVLGACGGGGTKTVSSPPTTAATAARAAFGSCLEHDGIPSSVAVDLEQTRRAPSTTPGSTAGGPGDTATLLPAGVTPTRLHVALQDCRHLLPRTGHRLVNGPRDAAYVNCLKLHGVKGSTTEPTTAPSSSLAAAIQACAALRPTPTATPSTTTPAP